MLVMEMGACRWRQDTHEKRVQTCSSVAIRKAQWGVGGQSGRTELPAPGYSRVVPAMGEWHYDGVGGLNLELLEVLRMRHDRSLRGRCDAFLGRASIFSSCRQ